MISAVLAIPPLRIREGLRTLLATRGYRYLKLTSGQKFHSGLQGMISLQ